MHESEKARALIPTLQCLVIFSYSYLKLFDEFSIAISQDNNNKVMNL